MKTNVLKWILVGFCISSCKAAAINWTEWRGKTANDTDYSYRWSNQINQNWEEAVTECAKHGWRLAKIINEREDKFLRNNLQASKTPSWIGLKLNVGSTKDHQEGNWSDGSPFKRSNTSSIRHYANWQPGEPKSAKQVGTCVFLNQNTKWDDHDCYNNRSFICQAIEVDKSTARLHNILTEDITEASVNQAIETADDLLSLGNITDPSKNLDDLDKIVERYQGDDYYGSMPLLNITINSTTRTGNLTFGSTDKLSLVLQNGVINEAFRREGRNLRSLRIGSISYESLRFFQVDTSIYADSRTSVDNHNYGTQPILADTSMNFGEDVIFSLRPDNIVRSSISASVSNVTMENLSNHIQITSQNVCRNRQNVEFEEYRGIHQLLCVYWSTVEKNWLKDGCSTELSPDPQQSNCYNVTCRCDHMTHFTIVFDSSYIYAPKYLNSITMAGGAICGTFLLITCISILSWRHMRNDIHKCIIFNISLNLFLFQLMFFVGIDQGSTPTRWCHATSYLLHLFTLTSWFWMLVESVYLLLSLCLRDNSSPKVRKIILVCGFFAYGVPALTASLTIRHQKPYLSPKYCWLASTAVFRTVVIPVISIWTINILVGGFAIYHITCAPRVAKMLHNMAKIRQAVRRIVFLSLLLGFPWISGLAMLFAQDSKTKTIVSIIFTVFLTMQGIAIFTAFCASDDIFRKRVKSAFAGLKCVSTAKSREVTEYLNIGSFESHQAYRITTVSRPGDTPAGLRAH